jgi:AcrR family transcriptional regulator
MSSQLEKNLAESEDESRKPGSGQTLRSERTRDALLTAAEKIFARDGFEASRIEDIAAEAGRSRGAFYANFDSKTEVFLALRSRAALQKAREFRELLQEASGDQARQAALHRHILEQICQSQSLLLQIEFKLFALRHPEMLAELSEKHLEASTSVHMKELADLFEEAEMTSEQSRRKTLAIEALLEGFALNMLFSSQVLTPEYLEQLIPRLLVEVLPPLPASK